MPEPTKSVWVVVHTYSDGEAVDVLGVFDSEEKKDQFLLRMMKIGMAGRKPLNLNRVKSHLVQMG